MSVKGSMFWHVAGGGVSQLWRLTYLPKLQLTVFLLVIFAQPTNF